MSSVAREPLSNPNMAQRGREKSPFGDEKRELQCETGLRHPAYLINIRHLKLLAGFRITFLYLEALAAIAVSLAILMATAWMVQRRTGNSGWVDTIWTFAVGFIGARSALWPIGGAAPNAAVADCLAGRDPAASIGAAHRGA